MHADPHHGRSNRAGEFASDSPADTIRPWSLLPNVSADDLLNGITDGFLLIDRDWRMVFFNEAARELLTTEADPDDLLGRVIWKAFPDLVGTELERQYRAVVEKRSPVAFENYYEPWAQWFEIRVFPWSHGGLLVFFRNVSERKALEQELRQKERDLSVRLVELEAIYQRAPLGLAVLDLDLKFLRINDHLAEINGHSTADHLGKNLEEIVPSLVDGVKAVRDKVVRSGEAVRVEFSGTTAAQPGIVRHWNETWYPLFNEAGSVFALGAVVEEIPPQQLVERELFRQALQLADAMPQLVWTANSAGVVDYYNERLSAYAGASQAEDGSWRWEPMLHPDDRESTWAAWRDAVDRAGEYRTTHRVRMADGTYRWHLSRAVPLKTDDGVVRKWFGTATDIDEQKQNEQRLETAVAIRTLRLEETVAELEAFSYSVSHDMRGPLRSMQTFSRILLAESGEKLDENSRRYIERIIASADRLDRLIQDVLAFSRVARGSLPLEGVDLGGLIDEIIISYPDLNPSDIAIVGSLPVVRANRAALTQCLANLLSNAVKFVAEGKQPKVVVSAQSEGDEVVVRITDNGVGVPASDQEKIFDLFVRGRRSEGTGIGLAIVKRAAERMGGKVILESSSPSGSTFALHLRAQVQ